MSMSAEDYAAMMVPPQQSGSVAPPPKKQKVKSKLVTGFILYSQEVRKAIGQSNPDLGFGDISRVVGNEWKSLSGDERDVYVRRASKLNEEVKAKMMEERDSFGNLIVPEGNFNIRKMGGTSNHAISKKKNKTSKFTGFILYSQEVRKNVRQNNPALGFGDISRIVGNDWTSLPGDEKQSWKDRATKMNETQQTMVL